MEGCKLDVEVEVNTVEMMYEGVRHDVETNTPDSYVSMSQARKTRAAALQPAIAEPAAARLRESEKLAEARIFASLRATAKPTAGNGEGEEILVPADVGSRNREWKSAATLV